MRPLVDLVDEMLARYVDWREDAAAVADAYARWCEAPAREGAWRFSAYMAALEREESAAISYASILTDLQRTLPSSRLNTY
jgi:hypothetical protein